MTKFTMKQLSKESGVSARKIRYYISEGLLASANGKGRGSYYTPSHLDQLWKILKLREQGLTLEQISDLEQTTDSWTLTTTAGSGPAQTHTHHIQLGSDVVWLLDQPGDWAGTQLTKDAHLVVRRGELTPKSRRKLIKALKKQITNLKGENE
jgi:DNA-binding transcriptional MerR regulator